MDCVKLKIIGHVSLSHRLSNDVTQIKANPTAQTRILYSFHYDDSSIQRSCVGNITCCFPSTAFSHENDPPTTALSQRFFYNSLLAQIMSVGMFVKYISSDTTVEQQQRTSVTSGHLRMQRRSVQRPAVVISHSLSKSL
jgi:hypothetical protein